jgi:hypothetical protein
MPSRDFGVPGTCATGSGLAPASLYASGGSGGGQGVGIGVGGRLGYHLTSQLAGRGATTWGLRFGGGLDLGLLYAKIATGIDDVTGKLCARVKADGTTVQYRGTAVLLAQVPLFVGPELGLGTLEQNGEWHGVVLAAAWTPAFTYLKPWIADGELRVSDLGAELALDFVTARQGAAKQTGNRVALFFVLPAQDRGPVLVTLSFGVLWY